MGPQQRSTFIFSTPFQTDREKGLTASAIKSHAAKIAHQRRKQKSVQHEGKYDTGIAGGYSPWDIWDGYLVHASSRVPGSGPSLVRTAMELRTKYVSGNRMVDEVAVKVRPNGNSLQKTTVRKRRRIARPNRFNKGGPLTLSWRLERKVSVDSLPASSKTTTKSLAIKGSQSGSDRRKLDPYYSNQSATLAPPPNIGNGVADPFLASPIPINHFLQHLLPLARRSYIYQHLMHFLPEYNAPGDEWLRGLLSHNTHCAYLYGYGLARGKLNAPTAKQSHLQAHLGYALTEMRQALQRGVHPADLIETNVILSAQAFYFGRIDEWHAHALARKAMLDSIGGVAALRPLLRAVMFISGGVTCGKLLTHPSFPSSDFEIDVPNLREDPMLSTYAPEIDISSIPIINPDLRELFGMHHEFHRLFSKFRSDAPSHPVNRWADRRFHHLNNITLEVYFRVSTVDPVKPSEIQQTQAHLDGTMALALTYLHQFIYHSARQVGDTDITSLWSPFLLVFFEHLRNNLKRMLDFENFKMMDDYPPILWAVFVLMCNEKLRAERNRLLGNQVKAEENWAAPVFEAILQRLDREERTFKTIKILLEQYLYDEVLDDFLRLSLQSFDRRSSLSCLDCVELIQERELSARPSNGLGVDFDRRKSL